VNRVDGEQQGAKRGRQPVLQEFHTTPEYGSHNRQVQQQTCRMPPGRRIAKKSVANRVPDKLEGSEVAVGIHVIHECPNGTREKLGEVTKRPNPGVHADLRVVVVYEIKKNGLSVNEDGQENCGF
jgi:hypothetical protein